MALYNVSVGAAPMASDLNQIVDVFKGLHDLGTISFAPTLADPDLTGFSAALQAGTNLGIGVYNYRFQYVTGYYKSDGTLSITGQTVLTASALSITTTSGNQAVKLTLPDITPIPSAVAIRIFRGAVGGTDYRLVATVQQGTVSYVDTTKDTSRSTTTASSSNTTGTRLGNHLNANNKGIYNLDHIGFYNSGIYDPTVNTNLDHIWHDDAANTFHFVSDQPYQSVGNGVLQAGYLNITKAGGSFIKLKQNDSDTGEYQYVGYYNKDDGLMGFVGYSSTKDGIFRISNNAPVNTGSSAGDVWFIPKTGMSVKSLAPFQFDDTLSVRTAANGNAQPIIKTLAGNTTGFGISITAGGLTIIGAGESAHNWLADPTFVDGTNEIMYVTSDREVVIKTNMQNGNSSAIDFRFNSDGTFNVPGIQLGGTFVDTVDGGLYYRASDSKFRVRAGGTWYSLAMESMPTTLASTVAGTSYPLGVNPMVGTATAGYVAYGTVMTVKSDDTRTFQMLFDRDGKKTQVRYWDGTSAWSAFQTLATADVAQMYKLTQDTGNIITLAANTDLNTVATAGMYYANATTTNNPYSNNVVLEVFAYAATTTMQRATAMSTTTPRQWIRYCSGGTWGAWVEVAKYGQPEAWTAPTLLNSWIVYNSYNAGYYKNPFSEVKFKGYITGGTKTSGTVLFTLPAGYRPGQNLVLNITTGTTSVMIAIGTNGNVSLNADYSAGTYIALDNISFRAEL
jgi:hypothetical protein